MSPLPNDQLLTEIFSFDLPIFFFVFFLSCFRSLWVLSNSSKRTLVFTLASLSTTNDKDSCHFPNNYYNTYLHNYHIKQNSLINTCMSSTLELTSPSFLENFSFGLITPYSPVSLLPFGLHPLSFLC